MNTETNKNIVIVISAIMAAAVTIVFFVLPITSTTTIAYLFALLAVAMFCAGKLYILANGAKSFAWFMAFPATIWRYLITQFSLSAIFIVWELLGSNPLPIGIFIAAHVIVFCFFSVFLLLMYGGKNVIERKDAEIKQKVSIIKMLQADVESILRDNPQHEKPLRQVIEAIKYSDPLSNPSVGIYEEEIQRSIMSMQGLSGNDSANIPEICAKLLKQIADRNARVKLMK